MFSPKTLVDTFPRAVRTGDGLSFRDYSSCGDGGFALFILDLQPFCSLKPKVVDFASGPIFADTWLAASKVMLLLLASLLPVAYGGKFMEIQGVSAAPGTSFGDRLTGNAASCKDACDKDMSCDCVLFDPLHGSCKMQADCLYFHPDYEGGGSLELYIKLPQYLWPFTVFPGTITNSDSKDIAGDKESMTEHECVNACLQRSDCQCAVLQTKDRWSSSSNHCWIRSNCQPQSFEKKKALDSYITFVKDPSVVVVTDAGGGSPVGLIVCLLLLLMLLIGGTLVVLYFLRNKGRAYRAVLQDLAVPKEEKSRRDYAKEQLISSCSRKSGIAYLSSLELALEAKVSNSDIPCVFSLHKVPETFKVPKVDTSVTSLKVQLCFVLDYTGSMKTQIAQAKDSVAGSCSSSEFCSFHPPKDPKTVE